MLIKLLDLIIFLSLTGKWLNKKKKLQEKLKTESKNPSKIKSIVQVTLSE